VGGHVTAIALAVGVANPAPNPCSQDIFDMSKMNMQHLRHSRYLSTRTGTWFVSGQLSIQYPFLGLPPLTADADFYLINDEPAHDEAADVGANVGGGGGFANVGAGGASASAGAGQPFQGPWGAGSSSAPLFGAPNFSEDQFSQLMGELRLMNTNFSGQFTTLNENVNDLRGRMEVVERRQQQILGYAERTEEEVFNHSGNFNTHRQDVQRALQPQYDFMYRSQVVNPLRDPIPSWYNIPPDNQMYTIGLSRGLGSLHIGNHGFQNYPPPAGLWGGDDDDEDDDGGDGDGDTPMR